MNKPIKYILLSSMLFIMGGSLTSCSKSDKITLRIINSEDYIFLKDEKDPESKENMTDQFKAYIANNKALADRYGEIEVVYDTSDTNETLYSELQTGKSNYDLMNVSDYMAQKIVAGNYAVPLYRKNGASLDYGADYNMIPNYNAFASTELKNRISDITATQKVVNEEGKYVDKTVSLKDYAVGYMWGTLGILFNPDYAAFEKIGRDKVITDMMSFNSLWDSTYNGTISIKNSMRDTYAVGLLYTYRDEIVANIASKEAKDADALAKYEAGTISEEEYNEALELSFASYKEKFDEIFNRCEENNVNDIKASLDELKKNIFGLEVDSGKEDIITKKIGINLAWSGDAVYSMDQGEDETKVGKDLVELCYSVPETGSNIWSDLWIMPNCARSQEQYELAHLFLDFISDPANAAQNMDYTGYTSFIGGDDIIDLVRSWYDIRYSEVYFIDEDENEYEIYSVDDENAIAIEFSDFVLGVDGHDDSRDEEPLYYYVPTGQEPEEYEVTRVDLLAQNHKVFKLDENDEPTNVQKTYGDLTIVNDPEDGYEEVDLSYFFNGTLTNYVDGVDTIFYSDCYLPFTYIDENGEEQQNLSVGRQFFCQYPNEDTINRCAVMKDYGENNKYVMKMWENFKSDPLPVWAIVVLCVFVGAAIGLIAYFVTTKLIIKSIRKKRLENK